MKAMMKFYAIVLVSGLFSIQVQAQDFDDLIKGSVKDANILVQGYVTPGLNAFSTGLNQGWYNTAKPHKKFGFDLTFSVAGVTIPSSEQFFTVDNSKLTEVALVTDHDGNQISSADGKGRIPTMFGPKTTQSSYDFKDPQNLSQPYNGPGGIDLKDEIGVNFLPVPVFSLGFGLPKSIELRFRFIPTVDLGDDGKLNFFGVGVMHDVKQYIPGIKMLPFDLSAFAGYTRMTVDVQIGDTDPNSPDYNPDQKGEFVVSATTIQGVISKKVSVLTVYGGVGYNITKTTLKAKGSYDLDDDPSNGNETTDPLNLSISGSGPRMTAGVRLKLAFFTLHGDYTLQKFSTFSAGFGINVR